MLLRVVSLRLREIALRILHELGLGCLAAEAVGLALHGSVDRAIRLHVFAHGETLRAHVVELTLGGSPASSPWPDQAPRRPRGQNLCTLSCSSPNRWGGVCGDPFKIQLYGQLVWSVGDSSHARDEESLWWSCVLLPGFGVNSRRWAH